MTSRRQKNPHARLSIDDHHVKLTFEEVSEWRGTERVRTFVMMARRYFHPMRGEEVEIKFETIIPSAPGKQQRIYSHKSQMVLTPADAERFINVIKGISNAPAD